MKRLILLLLTFLAPALYATELHVDDRPLVSRLALNKSPSRGIAVGYPNQFNVLLDSVNFTPRYVWSGGFLNVDGELRGRGGRACSILGPRVDLQLPTAPLRFTSPTELPATLVFTGYRRNGYEPPEFFADIDGHRVGLRMVREKRNQVTLLYRLTGERERDAFFAIDSMKASDVLPGPGLTWSANKKHVIIPAALKEFHITLDLSTRKSVVMQEEKMTGKVLYQQYCSACHALDAHKLIGPSFNELWGKKETVHTGNSSREIQVDANYLRRSILDPQADVVDGYQGILMPTFKGILSPEEVELLIQFIREGK